MRKLLKCRRRAAHHDNVPLYYCLGVLIIHKWRWIDELVLPEFQSSLRFCDYQKLTFRVRSAEIRESSVVRGFTQWVYYFGCSRICDENLLLRMYSSISLFGREDKILCGQDSTILGGQAANPIARDW